MTSPVAVSTSLHIPLFSVGTNFCVLEAEIEVDFFLVYFSIILLPAMTGY